MSIHFQLPDLEDYLLSKLEFQEQVEQAKQVCDRFDLQILWAVRDREKRRDGRSTGFLNWLKEREFSKSQAYGLNW